MLSPTILAMPASSTKASSQPHKPSLMRTHNRRDMQMMANDYIDLVSLSPSSL